MCGNAKAGRAEGCRIPNIWLEIGKSTSNFNSVKTVSPSFPCGVHTLTPQARKRQIRGSNIYSQGAEKPAGESMGSQTLRTRTQIRNKSFGLQRLCKENLEHTFCSSAKSENSDAVRSPISHPWNNIQQCLRIKIKVSHQSIHVGNFMLV